MSEDMSQAAAVNNENSPNTATDPTKHLLASTTVGEATANQGAKEQSKGTGTEERAHAIRTGPKFRSNPRGRDAGGLKVDPLAQSGR